jgi:hypothetical protein
MKAHPEWQEKKGWKSILNNLRLFLQPLYYFNLLLLVTRTRKPELAKISSDQKIDADPRVIKER